MASYQFSELFLRGEKRLRCLDCGKKIQRRRTFSEATSPFNKAPDGLRKTRHQILYELRQKIAEWQKKPELCTACSRAA